MSTQKSSNVKRIILKIPVKNVCHGLFMCSIRKVRERCVYALCQEFEIRYLFECAKKLPVIFYNSPMGSFRGNAFYVACMPDKSCSNIACNSLFSGPELLAITWTCLVVWKWCGNEPFCLFSFQKSQTTWKEWPAEGSRPNSAVFC